jgi:flagellar export protein FliJ
VETRESAQEVRNRCNSVADLQQWHQYVQALDIHVQASRTGVVDATATEASHRDAVAVAYREAKRWEMLADGSQRAYQEELRRVGQLEADEFASQRFGRGLR